MTDRTLEQKTDRQNIKTKDKNRTDKTLDCHSNVWSVRQNIRTDRTLEWQTDRTLEQRQNVRADKTLE